MADALGLDGGVLLAAGSLILLGVVMSYSATAALSLDRHIPPLFLKHLTALCLGGAGAAAGLWLAPSSWRRASLPLWLFSMGLLVATLLFGVEVRGAQRQQSSARARGPCRQEVTLGREEVEGRTGLHQIAVLTDRKGGQADQMDVPIGNEEDAIRLAELRRHGLPDRLS